jgi:hypothetical protein
VAEESGIQRIRLSDKDFALLLPSKVITVGESKITVYPLGLKAMKEMVDRLADIIADITSAGITFKNYTEPDKLVELVRLVMDTSPTLLADMSGIAMEDLERLLLATNVEIFTQVLQLNIESQEGLEKNLKSLTGMIQILTGPSTAKPTPDLGKLSKHLSQKVTPGKRSKNIH